MQNGKFDFIGVFKGNLWGFVTDFCRIRDEIDEKILDQLSSFKLNDFNQYKLKQMHKGAFCYRLTFISSDFYNLNLILHVHRRIGIG